MKKFICIIAVIAAISVEGFSKVPYNLSDFQNMNSGIFTSDESENFISMLEAYNYTYSVTFTVEELFQHLIPYDELFTQNCSISTRMIARTTGISSKFGWYGSGDHNDLNMLHDYSGDYFGLYDRPIQYSDPGPEPFGFYLDATISSHQRYQGGLWYSQSNLNNDQGNFDHLLSFVAPDVWLAGNLHVTSSYLMCWEDMYWRGGEYENNYQNGYHPNQYIPELGVRQSDRDYNDFIIQLNKIKPILPVILPVPEPSALLFMMLGFFLLIFFKKQNSKRKLF